MRDTPEMVMVSNALERPVGQWISNSLVSIGAVIGTILAAAKHSQAAIRAASVAFMFLIFSSILIIWKCGSSLVRTIDISLEKSVKARDAISSVTTPVSGRHDHDKAGGGKQEDPIRDPRLLGARKKIKKAMSFTLQMAVQTLAILMFAVVSKYGTAAPLILFGIPMGIVPLVWHFVNVQMHAGRSNIRPQGTSSGTSLLQRSGISRVIPSVFTSSLMRTTRLVVPTADPASP